ncbi:MAG: glycine cleavage T C-terminal barrel domain-containing protein, partial [Pseudomonadota bacterium]
GFDLSNEAFPFMGAGPLTIAGGIPARLFRISFSGELAYELAVPAGFGTQVWEAVMAAGRDYAIAPYGLEALNILRVEKGHATGAELDGRTTAADIGLAAMLNLKKDCIGGSLSQRPALTDPQRPRLVGVRCAQRPWERVSEPVTERPQDVDVEAGGNAAHQAAPRADGAADAKRPQLLAGAHLLEPKGPRNGATDQGWLASVAYSVELDEWIGLAFLKGGAERHGEKLIAADYLRGSEIEVEVTAPVFVDPQGERHHA